MSEEMRESPSGMSMYGLYQTCPRKWALKYQLGFQRSGEKTVPLAHGSAIHEGKKEFYKSWSIDKAVKKAKEVAGGLIEAFDDLAIENERIDKLFEVWYDTYGKEEQSKYDIISNETTGKVQLPNGAEITVRLDQVLRQKDTGHIYIFDTKTTGWSLEGTINEYNYKAQPLLYIASVYQGTPEWLGDFRGWITDVIYQRVNYRKDGSLSSITTKCQRSPAIMYTEDQCLSFLESLTTITSDVAWAYRNFEKGAPLNACFPTNRMACRNFNTTCQFWSICFDNFTVNSEPPLPFVRDTWYTDNVIKNVIKGVK